MQKWNIQRLTRVGVLTYFGVRCAPLILDPSQNQALTQVGYLI